MTGSFLIFLLLGLVDGAIVADKFRGQVSQNWGTSSSFFIGVLVANVLAVLWAGFMIALSIKRQSRWWSAGGWIIGFVVAFAAGFIAGIRT
jgi:fluoride ion exporter CrcB/FEX